MHKPMAPAVTFRHGGLPASHEAQTRFWYRISASKSDLEWRRRTSCLYHLLDGGYELQKCRLLYQASQPTTRRGFNTVIAFIDTASVHEHVSGVNL